MNAGKKNTYKLILYIKARRKFVQFPDMLHNHHLIFEEEDMGMKIKGD
jgi:hypothetical protein